VLGLLRESGTEPHVIEYLKTPPNRTELIALLQRLEMTPRQILRRRGTPFDELRLDDEAKSDTEIIDAILAHPILLERPIVLTPKGARVCRPSDTVRALLA
jgi:arsenate reductase